MLPAVSLNRSILLPILLLAGCVAAAWAGSSRDQLRLKDGRIIEGKIVGTRDGVYWIELPDGTLVSFPFSQIDLVERATVPAGAAEGDSSPAAPTLALPASEDELFPPPPSLTPAADSEAADPLYPPATAPMHPGAPDAYSVYPPAGEGDGYSDPPPAPPLPPVHARKKQDPFEAGFEVTSIGVGPRFSYKVTSPILDSIGIRGGVTTGIIVGDTYFAGSFSADLYAAVAVDWIGNSPIQIETTLGPALHMMYYPGMVMGLAARFEPPGHIQLNAGALLSVSLPYSYYPLVIPDVSVAFVW